MTDVAKQFGITDVGLAKRCCIQRIAYLTRPASRRRITCNKCAFLPYRSDEELLKKSLPRFFNLDGHPPSKVLATPTPPEDIDEEEDTDLDDD